MAGLSGLGNRSPLGAFSGWINACGAAQSARRRTDAAVGGVRVGPVADDGRELHGAGDAGPEGRGRPAAPTRLGHGGDAGRGAAGRP